MPANRIQGQTITLTDGTKVSGKTVRRASIYLVSDLAGYVPEGKGTFGTAKVRGYEIPVRRTRGRNGPWVQLGSGRINEADGGRGEWIF
jgi:hypothetical protein